jgi:hypothetical protein
VILGDVNLAACASADTTNVFDIGANASPGGSLADPELLYTVQEPGSDTENCTIHNYNIVPPRSGRYVAASGNYQAGTWVTDFTDPADPVTVAWSDPPPLAPTQLGGGWSSYWYGNFVFESEITKGLNVFRVGDPRLAGALVLGHLNPQTPEFTIG